MIVCYNDSIMNHISSLRSYFGLESQYENNVRMNALLKDKTPSKIYLFLIDGMGANLIERKLKEDSFLRRHLAFKTSTVFPPTTTAATTSILTGDSPNRTGWLGWIQYFKEVDNEVIPFLDKGFFDHQDYGAGFVMEKLPIVPMYDELLQKGIKATSIYPSFRDPDCKTFSDKVNKLLSYDANDQYRFAYIYEDQYDRLMHLNGPDSDIADDYLQMVNDELEKLANSLSSDALLLVTADHGQVAVKETFNIRHSKYDKYLRQRPDIEPRAMAFFVKEGMEEEFAREFVEEFEDRFILLNREQVLATHLFGDGENHKRLNEFIGDYLAIAKANTVLAYEEKITVTSKGQHAGMTSDELIIPIIAYKK